MAMPKETVKVCQGLSEAVGVALALAKENDTVLLSPASASYDEFSDFEERGEAFKKWILEGF
jgi:UDP-N-acetylmuramoylalanine--D-glutamate ligase